MNPWKAGLLETTNVLKPLFNTLTTSTALGLAGIVAARIAQNTGLLTSDAGDRFALGAAGVGLLAMATGSMLHFALAMKGSYNIREATTLRAKIMAWKNERDASPNEAPPAQPMP